MEQLVAKYADKMVRAGLCETPIVAGLDHELVFSGAGAEQPEATALMRGVFERMNIAGLVFGRPAGSFGIIVDHLATVFPDGFSPRDTETRTFLHHLPVIRTFTPEAVAGALAGHKSVIVAGQGIVTHGSVTPEQAFVTFSSVCFSSFVLFFSEFLRLAREGGVTPAWQAAYDQATALLERNEPFIDTAPALMTGPFTDRETMLRAMAEAGRATVDYKLVDSYFGNISYLLDETLWISETGSSLDELEGLIDPCPLDGSSTACLTASSELTAHQGVYDVAGGKALLHGHPRFTVILSMDCPNYHTNDACEIGKVDLCHIKCTQKRYLIDECTGGTPGIVPGEVGTGPHGLCHTLPPAMKERGAAAVWGHGLFTLGKVDFNEPFATLLGTENACRREYFRLVQQALEGAKQDCSRETDSRDAC